LSIELDRSLGPKPIIPLSLGGAEAALFQKF
jgi:hypothetical protein